jgi:hypothetical protein
MVVLVVVGGIVNLKDIGWKKEATSQDVTLALCNTMPRLHLVTLLIFTCKVTCRCSYVKITVLICLQLIFVVSCLAMCQTNAIANSSSTTIGSHPSNPCIFFDQDSDGKYA